MKTVIGLAAAGLIVLAFAVDQRVAAQPGAADPQVTIRYTGTLDTSWAPIMKQPDGRNPHSAQYQWALTWRGRLSQLEKQPTQSLTVGTLKGTVQYIDRTSAEHADCTGGFRPRVKTITFTASVSQGKLFVNVRVPVSSEFLQPTNTTSLHEFCSEVVRWALPGSEMIPTFKVDARTGGTDGRDVTIGPLGVNRERAALEHSVSVTIGGAGGAAAGIDMKANARKDFRRALERAKGPCLHFAISLGVMTTGAVWTSVAAPVPGGIPAGAAVIATGSVMGSVVAPMCTEEIKLARDQLLDLQARPARLPRRTRAASAVVHEMEGRGADVLPPKLEDAVTALVAAEHRVVVVLGRVQSAATALTAARRQGTAARSRPPRRRLARRQPLLPTRARPRAPQGNGLLG